MSVAQVNLEQWLREINSLKSKLDAQQGARIPGVFTRLLWVHHSTRLCGARLSLADTELLLQSGTEAPEHFPHRLVREVRGHAAAIDLLCAWAEAGITNLNRHSVEKLQACLLGVETAELRSQHKQSTLPGTPPFHHAAPADVMNRLDALLEWCQTYAFREHPLLIAAEWHLGILRIQPFERGNGRLARLLQNFPLIQHGFPPLVIPFDDREQYTDALVRAFSDDFPAFAGFLARHLLTALERRLEAGEVEDIDEDINWETDFGVLESSMSAYRPESVRSNELVYLRMKDSVIPLLERWWQRTQQLDQYFSDTRRAGTMYTAGQLFDFRPENLTELVEKIGDDGVLENLHEIEYIHRWYGRKGIDYADITASVKVRFEATEYVVYGPDMVIWMRKDLALPLLLREQNSILQQLRVWIMEKM
ncbi:MAG: Fic family protein [Saprospiraceae bacterium]|nr:Fic family protein [Saprospiraceae bacterium]